MGSPSTVGRLSVPRLLGVGLVVFVANAALLVLQLVAGKLLAPFVGSSLETWTSVIGIFLAGIALGNGFGGKLADRYPSPRTLAVLLGLGAVAALWMIAVPLLLDATGAHRILPLTVRIPLLAFVLCFPVGLVLSLLTPLAIKLGLPDVARAGRVAGLVFALSTLGCLLGNYLTGFYLIPMFTLNGIVAASAGVLAVLAVGTALAGGKSTPNPFSAAAPLPDFGVNLQRAYVIVFLASFGGMTLELTASRLLAQFLGVSLYTWTGIIGVMLAGTALGNFAGGLLADRMARRDSSGGAGRMTLAVTLLFAAGATVTLFVTMAILTRLEVFAAVGLVSQVLGWTFALFFPPMFILGMVSPQMIRLVVPDVSHVGAVAGRVYGWSTAGAIAGAFATGYLLLSGLGVNWTLLTVALLLTSTSLIVAPVWKSNPSLYLLSVVGGGVIGGFLYDYRVQASLKPGSVDGGALVARRETNYYTITVNRDVARPWLLRLVLDHLMHSTVDPEQPTFLHYEHEGVQLEVLRDIRDRTPEPKVLVIGGGGYTFPRCVKTVLPEVGVDVVEIDPGVTKVAVDVLGFDPALGVRTFNMDGRQYVDELAAPASYDLVTLDAVNDLSVPAHLMTKEFNEAVKRCLKPEGVYLLTVIDGVRDGKIWKAAVRTLRQSFPHVSLVASSADWIFTRRHVFVIYASDRPLNEAKIWGDAERRVEEYQGRTAGPLAAVASGLALASEPWVYSHVVPAAIVEDLLATEPPVILTDQYAPVDNMMADVFRKRVSEAAGD